jgi:hypothetical protein
VTAQTANVRKGAPTFPFGAWFLYDELRPVKATLVAGQEIRVGAVTPLGRHKVWVRLAKDDPALLVALRRRNVISWQ